MTHYLHNSGQITTNHIGDDDKVVVVIDPAAVFHPNRVEEPRERLVTFLTELRGGNGPWIHGGTDHLDRIIQQIVGKPDEPAGLGAVVEDVDGADWHRTRDGRWIAEDGLRSRAAGWVHIDAVRVLSEGVPS